VVARGRHTVFLGMAPGVGKTYQMLEDAHELQRRGRDVVIGFLEAHGRADTLAQAGGLESVPRQHVSYGAVALEEPDWAAILRRRPQLCLIDELAHTNAPGCEHRKRYEDVDTILAAGIDVYSTVNVQHLESLAGQVTALIGVPVSETLPDAVLEQADEVVLVDVTPELLIERLKAGRIYSGPSIEVAQAGFFRPERLATLRELSLLWLAEDVEPGRKGRSEPVVLGTPPAGPVPSPVLRVAPPRERVLALATVDAWSRPTVYHAYHAARRLDAPLDVLCMRAEGAQAPGDGGDELAALDRLVSTLGGELLVRDRGDLVTTAAQVAADRGATYLVIGRPWRRTPFGRLAHRRLPLQLMRAMPNMDVQIVALADPSPRPPRGYRRRD
jgi:two-component system sensor histidine kinase KdpD